MATIQKRKKANGKFSYTALIRIKKEGRIIHSESQTFPKDLLARDWAQRREVELKKAGALEQLQFSGVTLCDLIDRYIEEFDGDETFGRSKLSHLKWLKEQAIANVAAVKLTTDVIFNHALVRSKNGASPATVNNDIVWISVVCKMARAAWSVPVDINAITDAALLLRSKGVTGKSRRRNRRPTADELEKLSDYFKGRNGWSEVPMHDLMWFAVHSARREGEITRVLWSDNDDDHMTGMVRDAKHPRHKIGNHRTFRFTQEAWDIAQRQPKGDVRIFPFNPKTVSAYFTNACKILEIEDLRFHDLRHEATSRLFEAGYSIQEVQQFTLHESWAELKRYTHLRAKDVTLR